MSIRILLADDHRILREGLRSLIEQNPDLEVVAQAEDGRTAVRLVQEHRPDVAIMDIGMPELNGMEAARQIVGQIPGVRVIALSIHAERWYVAGMFQAGAWGYLLKNCAFEELVQAIRTVMAGQHYLSPAIADVVVEDFVRNAGTTGGLPPSLLTAREREVLQLLAEGHTTKEIADRLQVSAKTVDVHRQNMMAKLDLHSIADLTKYAIRAGLTDLEG